MEEEMKSLLKNYLVDLKKKEIDKFARAKLLEITMREFKLSQRALGEKIGVPHSTIADWLLINKLDEQEYKDMKTQGLNDTEIYRELRNNQKEDKEVITSQTKTNRDLDEIYKRTKQALSTCTKEYINEETDTKILEVINLLNRLRMKVERFGK